MRDCMRVNWKDVNDVISYADDFGPGMTVYKHPQRDNYNIIHTSREAELARGVRIIHRTRD